MSRIRRLMAAAWLGTVLLTGIPASGSPAANTPVFESDSSGLIAFSAEDAAIRVAVVFAEQDEAVVPTVIRFLDARGNVLKRQRGELRDGQPVIVELTRQDVGAQADLLVRVEVIHKLPGVRNHPYPIIVTTQPIALGGFGRFALDWGGGSCGCPGPACGPPPGHGQHVNCVSPGFTDM
jgi:hypothetical protein